MLPPSGRHEYRNAQFAAFEEFFKTPARQIPGKYPLVIIGVIGIVLSSLFVQREPSDFPWFFIISAFIFGVGFYVPTNWQYAKWKYGR